MEKETFRQVFLRKDNWGPLAVVLLFIIIGLLLLDYGTGEGGGLCLVIAAVVLAVDAACIYAGLNEDR